LITRIIFGEDCGSLIFWLCSLLHSRITSCPLGPNIFLSTNSRTPSACVPPSIRETKFHTHTNQQAKF
jgi:hypothetical protein